MKITAKQEKEIKNEMADAGMCYCNACESYFIVRNTNEGIINENICPCCGVYGDHVEQVEVEV